MLSAASEGLEGTAAAIAGRRQEARLSVEEELLTAWARARREADPEAARRALDTARTIAEALARGHGDQLLREAVAAIDRALERSDGGAEVLHLAAGHHAYGEAVARVRERRFDEARPLLEEAFRHLDGRTPFALWVRFLILRCDFQSWHHDRVLAGGRKILDRAHDRRYLALTGRTSWVLGTTLISLGRPEESLRAYRRAAADFEAAGEPANRAAVLSLLAGVLDYLGATEEAWQERLRALRLGLGERQRRLLFTSAAFSAAESGKMEAALAYAREAAALAKKEGDPLPLATALLHRAALHRIAGQRRKAAVDLAGARRLIERIPGTSDRESLRGELLLESGRLLRTADPAAAVASLTAAEEVFRHHDYPLHFPRLYYERAHAARVLGELEAAERDLDRAVAAVEGQRSGTSALSRITFLDRVHEIFEARVLHELEDGRPLAALEVSEQARARVLVDWLAQLPPASGEVTLPRSVASLRPLAELRASLPPASVYLQYEVTPERLLIWAVRRGGVSLETVQVSAERLSAAVDRFHRTRHRVLEPTAAEELHELLIRPVERHLAAAEELVVSPDESLHSLPFAALRDRRSGRFLLEDLRISSAPSLNAHAALREREGSSDLARAALLVAAAPELDRSLHPELVPLPGARREGRAIAALYPGARLLSGDRVTRPRLLTALGTAEIFHFAGHAVANERVPLLSALLLTPTGPDDAGVLRAREVLELSLPRTRLVVLASCRSAGVVASETEGPLGLAWPFLARGVPTVIAGLWEVDDATTSELFPRFYHHLRRGSGPASALRAAQLELLAAGTDDPGSLDWAAFQLYGAG